MRRKISLYIADREADFSEDALVLMNYTFEDLTNPTIVKNSYSKSITLEGTPNNNAIFGEFWRLDRTTDYGTGAEFSGIYFDATRKTPFKIYDEKSNILVSGYCKLDKIVKKGAQCTYTISLYGGFGTFLYNLSYNSDGSKRTLKDLTYKTSDGRVVSFGMDLTYSTGMDEVKGLWDNLQGLGGDKRGEVFNFAPFYNGYPKDFDTKHAIVEDEPLRGRYTNIPVVVEDGGLTYSSKGGVVSVLVSFENQHTEWEIRDLRWYLQRPVFRMKALIDAIGKEYNNGGYKVEYDAEFFGSESAPYNKTWITLPIIATADRENEDCIINVLKSSLSPAEYLLSFAKMYGLVFLCDEGKKTIKIIPRKKFFTGKFIDISDRVDNGTIDITPYVAVHRYYQMGGAKPVIGEWAKAYKEDFGREYGIQKIDTGYDFDRETEIITKDIPINEGTDVQERDAYFFTDAVDTDDQGLIVVRATAIPTIEKVSVQLWTYDNKEVSKDFPVASPPYNYIQAISLPRYLDWLPKVQMHEKEDKGVEGSNMFVFFNGMKKIPKLDESVSLYLDYHLSNDTPDMENLNALPCWNWQKREDVIEVGFLPSFLRNYVQDTSILQSGEWGIPAARGVPFSNPSGSSLYNDYWKRYLTDRYDVDTKVMRCKVNLRGMVVGQELMRNFYFYDGVVWVLNRIENYSLTTDDLVECEFVKVKDIQNYIA